MAGRWSFTNWPGLGSITNSTSRQGVSTLRELGARGWGPDGSLKKIDLHTRGRRTEWWKVTRVTLWRVLIISRTDLHSPRSRTKVLHEAIVGVNSSCEFCWKASRTFKRGSELCCPRQYKLPHVDTHFNQSTSHKIQKLVSRQHWLELELSSHTWWVGPP